MSLNNISPTIFAPRKPGKCPWCHHAAWFDPLPSWYKNVSGYESFMATQGGGLAIGIYGSQCPNCKKPIVVARITEEKKETVRLLIPRNYVRIVPPEVPNEIAEDFLEAAAVHRISEKASAALSRRCLQNLLNERGMKKRNLSDQIDEVLKILPTDLAENVDSIRVVGNFAAHPMKSQSTGLIVEVEPEEASWNLDVLEDLFDYFYVRPARAKEKRKRLDEKLKDLGKPKLKKLPRTSKGSIN